MNQGKQSKFRVFPRPKQKDLLVRTSAGSASCACATRIKNISRNHLLIFLNKKKRIYFTEQRFGKRLSIKLKHFAVIVSRIQRRPVNGTATPCGLVRLLTGANKLEWEDYYQGSKQYLLLLLTSYLVSLCHSESYQRLYVEKSNLFVSVLEHPYLTEETPRLLQNANCSAAFTDSRSFLHSPH